MQQRRDVTVPNRSRYRRRRGIAMRLVACAIGTLLMLKAGLGSAQERHGFWFNGGLGYGSLGCDNCGSREGGLSGGLSLGGTLSPKWLLGVGTSGWYKDEGGASVTIG